MIPTVAHKLLRRCGEDQLVPHWPRVGAASDAGLDHVVVFDELSKPGHRAVAVQGVVAQCPAGGSVGY